MNGNCVKQTLAKVRIPPISYVGISGKEIFRCFDKSNKVRSARRELLGRTQLLSATNKPVLYRSLCIRLPRISWRCGAVCETFRI